MCGIAGIFNHRSGAPVPVELLETMAGRMAHRGPDGAGFSLDGALGLAHRRLAVIDLDGGHQPMTSPDGRVTISYNGEVYNYLELRRELEARGHQFVTESDTEVVLVAYLEWGLEFAKRLNGMFALAIWDGVRLVLARDRMGIKPLFLATTGEGVAFASELKALRAVPGVGDELDLMALDEYLTCGYVVHPRSVVRGCEKVAPGTLVVFERDREPRTHKYFELRFHPDRQRSEADWEEELRDTFTKAVRQQLRSDVPLGALLSGGVDSTLITSTMARELSRQHRIDSYCVGVDVPGARNEFDFARRVARSLDLEHHEKRLSASEFVELTLEAAQLLDEPIVEPMVGQLLGVCRFARESVTVVLSGEGSDETWFGYPTYRIHGAIEAVQRIIPRAFLARGVAGLNRLSQHIPLSAKVLKHARNLPEPIERRYLGLSQFDPDLKNMLYRPSVRAQMAGHDARETMLHLHHSGGGGPETISQMAAVDCKGWLVDNTLMRSDLMSMAASLELRVPFLDNRLVDLALRVPARLKVSPTDQKVVLKRALADRLPRSVATRRKVGFPTPLAELFRGGLGQRAETLFREPCASTRSLFDHGRIRQLLDHHRDGRANNSRVLFQMLMLEAWARRFEEAA